MDWAGPARGCAVGPPRPDPFSPLTVCGDLPPQVSETFFSSFSCQSLSSLTRALIPHPLTAPLPPTLRLPLWVTHSAHRQPRLFSFSLVGSEARYLSADPRARTLAVPLSNTPFFIHPSFGFTSLSSWLGCSI